MEDKELQGKNEYEKEEGNFTKGMFFGILLSIPIWILIGVLGSQLWDVFHHYIHIHNIFKYSISHLYFIWTI